MSNSRFDHYSTVVALLLTVVIDIMGIGLIFPVLPELFSITHNQFFLNQNSLYTFFCVTMMIVPLGWTISGLVMGYLADMYGRKRMIMLSLIISGCSYGLSIYAISLHNLALFLFSRFLIGASGGCYCLVQTVMCDIAPEGKLSKYLSWVNCVSALGFVMGALITSISTWKYISASLYTPFIIGSCLSFIDASMVFYFVKESNTSNASANNKSLIETLKSSISGLLNNVQARNLLIAFFLIEIAWGVYLQALPMILSQLYMYTTNNIATFYLAYGICAATAILIVQPAFEKVFTYEVANPWLSWIVKITLAFSFIIHSHWANISGMLIATTAEFLLFTGVLVLISENSDESSRGQTMGMISTLIGASFLISDILIFALKANYLRYNLLLVALLFPGFYFLSGKSTKKTAETAIAS